MLNQLLNTISFISIYTIVTFLVAMVFYKPNYMFKLLVAILLINVATELTALFFQINNMNIINIYNIYFILHNSLWLYLIIHTLKQASKEFLVLFLFLGLAIFNLIYIEKNNLNYYTFITGGIGYLIYYMAKSFVYLKNEQLTIFKSNTFILLSAPIIFFIGFIIVFGFRDSQLRFIKIGYTALYSVISLIVNIIYYSLLNLYIYKTRKENE